MTTEPFHLHLLCKTYALKAALYEDFSDNPNILIRQDSKLPPNEPCDVLIVFCSNSYALFDSPDTTEMLDSNCLFRIKEYITDTYLGEQPVGSSFLVTGAKNFRYICWTCISRTSSSLASDFAYSSLWSSFCAINYFNRQLKKKKQKKNNLNEKPLISIAIPDLTEICEIDLDQEVLKDYVRQIELALRTWVNLEVPCVRSIDQAVARNKLIVEKKVGSKQDTQIVLQGFLYHLSGDILKRGLCNLGELEILMEWLVEDGCKHTKASAQALCGLMSRPDTEFALTKEVITGYILASNRCLSTLLDMTTKGTISLHQEIHRNELIVASEAQLGQGTAGTVQIGTWKNIKVAIKHFTPGDNAEKEFRREVSLLSLTKHRNIVTFYGASTNIEDLFLVEELMVGSLYEVLHDKKVPLDDVLKLEFAGATAMGMRYLHRCNLIHRDLKSLNVLVGPNFETKICDFGLSRFCDKSSAATMTGNIGTVCWIAPEIFAKKTYDRKVDVYSFAVVFWEILTRQEPFSGISTWSVPMAVLRGERPALPKDTNRLWAKLIIKCWNKRPAVRPEFAEIVSELKKIKIDLLAANAQSSMGRPKKMTISRAGKKFSIQTHENSIMDSLLSQGSDFSPARSASSESLSGGDHFSGSRNLSESSFSLLGISEDDLPRFPEKTQSNSSSRTLTKSRQKKKSISPTPPASKTYPK